MLKATSHLLSTKRLENTEGAIKNIQPRETGHIEYTRRRQTKQKHNTISRKPLYVNKYKNVNKTCYRQTFQIID